MQPLQHKTPITGELLGCPAKDKHSVHVYHADLIDEVAEGPSNSFQDSAPQDSVSDALCMLNDRADCLLAYAHDWGLLEQALTWAVNSEQQLSALTDAFMVEEMDPSRLGPTYLVGLGRLECGSAACPNVTTWSDCCQDNLPHSWRSCKVCGSIYFCCQSCEEDANRAGHSHSCSTLCSLNPITQIGRSASDAEDTQQLSLSGSVTDLLLSLSLGEQEPEGSLWQEQSQLQQHIRDIEEECAELEQAGLYWDDQMPELRGATEDRQGRENENL